MKKLYRHSADIPASLIILAVFAAQLTIFFAVDSHLAACGWVFLLLFVQVSAGAICHNHHHVNTFTRPWLNRLYEIIMYLETGTSPYSWTIHHNIGHHKLYLDPDKDPSRWLHRNGKPMSRLYYDVYNAIMIYPEIIKLGRQHPVIYRKFKRMFLLANLPLLFFLWLDPVRTLIVFIAPMVLLLFILLDNTYQQHAETGLDNHYEGSRNVLHPIYNLTSWNLGYHTAHHMYPGIHWTRLPALHETIKDKIPEALISHNLIYHHKPYQPQPEQPPACETT